MRDKKRIVVIAAVSAVLLVVILAMVLIRQNKKSWQQGGEDTNFPYSWKEERRGTVLLKLDGSCGPEDYHWSISSTDESVLEVKVAKKEKNGLITYRIKPLKEGVAQITFERQRDMESLTGTAEESLESKESGASGEQGDDGVEEGQTEEYAQQEAEADPEEMDPSVAAEEASAAAAASQRYEEYLGRFRAKDSIAEVKVRLDAEPTGKKDKLKLALVLAEVQEHKGVMQNANGEGGFSYQVWEDSQGAVQVRLPELGESWSASWDGEYMPSEEQEFSGITVSRPEFVDGRYVILDILEEGYLEGAYCYTVQGLDQGSATVKFSNPKSESSLLIHVMISRDGKITVIGHNLEAPNG